MDTYSTDAGMIREVRRLYDKRKSDPKSRYSQRRMATDLNIDPVHLNRLFKKLKDKQPIILHGATRSSIQLALARTTT